MPTVDENKRKWDDTYHWDTGGDCWSGAWGSAEMQWHASILPRIHRYLPAATILEIAPGFGRWTEFLKENCDELIVVDLSEKCIEACRERFGENAGIRYHVNDGRSLDMIEDDSVDFVFSFDSLVHVESDVIESYLKHISRILKKDGLGFLHHSNAGAYAAYFKGIKRFSPLRSVLKLLSFSTKLHSRGLSVTAEKFRDLAKAAGLTCLSQEVINWHSKLLLDCLSVIAKGDTPGTAPGKIIRNPHFMDEARHIALISPLYTRS